VAESFVLETSRLLIRPLDAADSLSYQELIKAAAEPGSNAPPDQMFQWYQLASRLQAMLYQPPYGDRAIVLNSTNTLVGSAGFVPCLDFFGQLPGWEDAGSKDFRTPEVGLFYAVHPDHRGHGYASEAAAALIDYAFSSLKLKRVIAVTDQANYGSQGVMRKVGMRLLRNPLPEMYWLQIVGVIDHCSRKI
jgi:ribosomal-protein-alanine N-acetyltransferase